jgi:hypothetical protein
MKLTANQLKTQAIAGITSLDGKETEHDQRITQNPRVRIQASK